MATIHLDNPVVTVMVQFTVDGADQERLVEMMKDLVPAFAGQRGFISANLHKSIDGTRIVQYLQWKTMDDHLACMQNLELQTAGAEVMSYVHSGEVAMDVHVYEVVNTMEA